MTEPEKRITYLGTITTDPDTALAVDVPPTATPAQIRELLIVAEQERIAAAKKETARLHEMFLASDDGKDERHE
jgi:hypothetical protein